MTEIDPSVAAAVRAALGLREGDADLPGDLADHAAAVNAADACRADAGSVLLAAVAVIRAARAADGTFADARRALAAAAWPLTTVRDLADLAAALAAMCAGHMTGEDLDHAEDIGRDLP